MGEGTAETVAEGVVIEFCGEEPGVEQALHSSAQVHRSMS